MLGLWDIEMNKARYHLQETESIGQLQFSMTSLVTEACTVYSGNTGRALKQTTGQGKLSEMLGVC